MKKIFLITICLILSAVTQAEVITIFDSNSIISNGDTYDTVVVKGDGTVVEMTGGDIALLIVMNTSTFNMTGGHIESGSDGIRSYDSSVLNLAGGQVKSVKSHGESNLNLSGSCEIGLSNTGSHFYDSSVISISSASATAASINLYDNSELELSAGSVQWIMCYANNTVNISGGTVTYSVDTQWVNDNAVCNIDISGGTMNSFKIGVRTIATISGGVIVNDLSIAAPFCASIIELRIIGTGLSSAPYGGSYGHGQISGAWNDLTPLIINLNSMQSNIAEAYSKIILYDGTTPLDCSNPPQSDISGDCLVNNLDLTKMASEWLDDGTE